MKEMIVKLEEIFKQQSLIKRGIPSVKVISGIIGKCWIAPCKNRDIAEVLGVSDGVISEAINNHLKTANIIIVEVDQEMNRFNNINFKGLIDYFEKLVEKSFKGNKEEVLRTIKSNRSAVGKSFLFNFVVNHSYERSLSKVKKLYQLIPELLFLLILSLDATAPTNRNYLHFLRCIYKSIMLKADKEYPELVYVWSGMSWFMLDFED